MNKTLLDTLPILTDGLNIVKKELETTKNVMEIEINNLLGNNDLLITFKLLLK